MSVSEESNDDPELSEDELNEKTRERFRQKLREGELDDRKIEINIQQSMASSSRTHQ